MTSNFRHFCRLFSNFDLYCNFSMWTLVLHNCFNTGKAGAFPLPTFVRLLPLKMYTVYHGSHMLINGTAHIYSWPKCRFVYDWFWIIHVMYIYSCIAESVCYIDEFDLWRERDFVSMALHFLSRLNWHCVNCLIAEWCIQNLSRVWSLHIDNPYICLPVSWVTQCVRTALYS